MIDHCRHCPNVTRTDKKKFVCFACSYATQYACYIKTHVMTHTGDKPFACSFCDYTCNQSSNLQTHLRIHKTDRMYSCGKCSYQTPSLADLKLHLKNMHLYWLIPKVPSLFSFVIYVTVRTDEYRILKMKWKVLCNLTQCLTHFIVLI